MTASGFSEVLKSFLFEKYDYAVTLKTVLYSEKLSDLNMLKVQALHENSVLPAVCEGLQLQYIRTFSLIVPSPQAKTQT